MPKKPKFLLLYFGCFSLGWLYLSLFSNFEFYAPLRTYLALVPIQIAILTYLGIRWNKSADNKSPKASKSDAPSPEQKSIT